MNKSRNFLFFSLLVLWQWTFAQAETQNCQASLTQEIYHLFKDDPQNTLSLRYQLALFKMKKIGKEKDDLFFVKAFEIEKEIKKRDQLAIGKLDDIYKLYGKHQDIEKILENLGTICSWKKECAFYDEDISSYLEAKSILKDSESDFNESDAAIIWLVENLTKGEITTQLLVNSAEEDIEAYTHKINESFKKIIHNFFVGFKGNCLNEIPLASCQLEINLIAPKILKSIDLLSNELNRGQITNHILEDQLRENYSGKVDFGVTLVAEKNAQSNIIKYISKPRRRGRSSKQNKAIPIKIQIIDPRYQTEDSIAFVQTLEKEKEHLMKLYHLSNLEYDELAKYAFGILGNETKFGQSYKYMAKEAIPIGVAYLKEWRKNVIYKTRDDYKTGVKKGGVLEGLKEGAESYYNHVLKMDVKILSGNLTTQGNSRGPTQIKKVPILIEKDYGIKEEDLSNPENSAVATLGFLAVSLQELRANEFMNPAINAKNRLDYLHYIYMGSIAKITNRTATPDKNIYLRNLKKYEEGIQIVNSKE